MASAGGTAGGTELLTAADTYRIVDYMKGTEQRTRQAAREVHVMTVHVGNGKLKTVASIDEAVAVVERSRGTLTYQAWYRRIGTLSGALVSDAAGKPVASISYNGRVWPVQ